MLEIKSVTSDTGFTVDSESFVENRVQSVAFYGDDGSRIAPPDDFEPGRLRFETFNTGQKLLVFSAENVVITSGDDIEQLISAIWDAWQDSPMSRALKDSWDESQKG